MESSFFLFLSFSYKNHFLINMKRHFGSSFLLPIYFFLLLSLPLQKEKKMIFCSLNSIHLNKEILDSPTYSSASSYIVVQERKILKLESHENNEFRWLIIISSSLLLLLHHFHAYLTHYFFII